jgi:hypothetical protein
VRAERSLSRTLAYEALAESEAALALGKSGGKSDKFSIVRQAQVRDGRQLLDVLVLSI